MDMDWILDLSASFTENHPEEPINDTLRMDSDVCMGTEGQLLMGCGGECDMQE